MIYEAHEPSSACRLWRIFMVETSTPPKRTGHKLATNWTGSSRDGVQSAEPGHDVEVRVSAFPPVDVPLAFARLWFL